LLPLATVLRRQQHVAVADDAREAALERLEVARHRVDGRPEAAGSALDTRRGGGGRIDHPAPEGLDVHAVRPQAVLAEDQARDAPHPGGPVAVEVAGDHLDEGDGAAAEEDRVAVVLEDLDPALEAGEMLVERP